MKFSKIRKGKLATRVIELPLVTGPGEPPQLIQVGIRVLSPDETAETLVFARDFAIARKNPDPKPGDPLYELGIRVGTLLLACFDPDAEDPLSVSARFFASEKEILGAHEIGRDGIHFLYEHQEAWQDACSPQPSKMGEGEFWKSVMELVNSDDPLACERWRPATRASFMRTMAQTLLLLISQMPKSQSGLPEGLDTTTLSSEPSERSQSPGADEVEA